MSLGEEIKGMRMELFMSQEDFARLLRVSFSTVNRWEMGHTLPSYGNMKKLAQFAKDHNVPFGAMGVKRMHDRGGDVCGDGSESEGSVQEPVGECRGTDGTDGCGVP